MTCPSRFELFDHTADIGVRVFAPTLTELVAPAVAGLYAVIGALVPSGPVAETRFSFSGAEPALLLRDYLAELLRLFDAERRMVTAVAAEEFDRERLTVVGQMRAVDMSASELEREAKAVTYHRLELRPVAGGYEATFIVDI